MAGRGFWVPGMWAEAGALEHPASAGRAEAAQPGKVVLKTRCPGHHLRLNKFNLYDEWVDLNYVLEVQS